MFLLNLHILQHFEGIINFINNSIFHALNQVLPQEGEGIVGGGAPLPAAESPPTPRPSSATAAADATARHQVRPPHRAGRGGHRPRARPAALAHSLRRRRSGIHGAY